MTQAQRDAVDAFLRQSPVRHRVEDTNQMTRADLADLLVREGFRPDSYDLYSGSGKNECYVLDHAPTGWWHIYYAERGLNSLGTFATEAAACAHFLDVLRRDRLTRQS